MTPSCSHDDVVTPNNTWVTAYTFLIDITCIILFLRRHNDQISIFTQSSCVSLLFTLCWWHHKVLRNVVPYFSRTWGTISWEWYLTRRIWIILAPIEVAEVTFIEFVIITTHICNKTVAKEESGVIFYSMTKNPQHFMLKMIMLGQQNTISLSPNNLSDTGLTPVNERTQTDWEYSPQVAADAI